MSGARVLRCCSDVQKYVLQARGIRLAQASDVLHTVWPKHWPLAGTLMTRAWPANCCVQDLFGVCWELCMLKWKLGLNDQMTLNTLLSVG